MAIFRPDGGGQTALDRARETYPTTGTLKHAGLSGFQLTGGANGCTISSVEGPDNAADFAGLALSAGQELVFGQPITGLQLSSGDGVVYNSTERTAQWFVSSVNGSDDNTGLAVSAQLKTISKLMEHFIAAGDTIILENGSFWREELEIGNNVTVKASDPTAVANKPILDAADIVSKAEWNLSPGQSNTYEVSWVPLAGDGADNVLTAYEDGDLLLYQSTIADVEAIPGSYTVNGFATTDGNIVYVHPKSSTNPAADSKEYLITKRGQTIYGLNDCTIDGVVMLRNVSNNGTLELKERATIRNSSINYGTKHNFLIVNGTIEDSEVLYNDHIAHPSSTLGVAHTNLNLTPAKVNVTRTRFVGGNSDFPNDWPSGTPALISHGEINPSSINYDDCIFENLSGIGVTGAPLATIKNCELIDTPNVIVSVVENVVENNFIKITDRVTSASVRLIDNQSNTLHRFNGNRVYSEKTGFVFAWFFGDGTLESRNNSFFGTAPMNHAIRANDGIVSNVTFERNIMNAIWVLRFDTQPNNSEIDNNLYRHSTNPPSFVPSFVWEGTTYSNDFAGWQVVSGGDANSLVGLDPGFVDPSNGDFTTTAPEVDTLQAGVEYYVAS